MKKGLAAYDATRDPRYLEDIKKMFIEKDYLCKGQEMDLLSVKQAAEDLLKYRHFEDHEGSDGLDSVRPVSYTHLDVYKRQALHLVYVEEAERMACIAAKI